MFVLKIMEEVVKISSDSKVGGKEEEEEGKERA